MLSKRHPLVLGGRLSLYVADLKGERLVLRGACELPYGALRDAGIDIRIAARAERDELAMAFVGRGLGFAIAPRSLASGEVVPVSVADLGLSRQIGLTWKRPEMEAAAEALADILSEIRR
ncbi:hypothetical protein Salmuc_02888 [Salipiger mucosus DSM 16094]|uniref:LysR substrate-binding domain-containing protein n=2 Tax=Salipiger mucosus TaxID=263378 RepID=S9Q4V7_9RHOB|nr:hypothetical protein Salmuc_02888 [Salipiger mucosus DSM 16094]